MWMRKNLNHTRLRPARRQRFFFFAHRRPGARPTRPRRAARQYYRRACFHDVGETMVRIAPDVRYYAWFPIASRER